MNRRYVRELRIHLLCSFKVKKRLLEHFSVYRQNLLDEPLDYDQMVAMFGPPEEMARVLMDEVQVAEQVRYRRNKRALNIVAAVLLAGIMMLSVYAIFIKEATVVEVKTYTYYGELHEVIHEGEEVE